MPEICRFHGIVIRMFYKPKEHEPAHIHAYYGDGVGIFDVHTHEMVQGDLPMKVQEMIQEWLGHYDKELIQMWNTQNIEKLPPL